MASTHKDNSHWVQSSQVEHEKYLKSPAKPGPSCRGVLAGLPHTTYRLPDRAPRLEGPGRKDPVKLHFFDGPKRSKRHEQKRENRAFDKVNIQ